MIMLIDGDLWTAVIFEREKEDLVLNYVNLFQFQE